MPPIDPTGGVGKAVEKAVDTATEVIRGDPEDRAALRKIGEQSGELDAAAQARARRQAVTQHVLLKVVQPLGRLAGVPKDYFNFKFAVDMANKLKDVPEDQLVEPKGSVAGPAIQGMWFTLDEPQLKEMYLNLLATASDARIRERAHPAFAQLIAELSSVEAHVLGGVLVQTPLPLVELRLKAGPLGEFERGYTVLATHMLDWRQKNDDGSQRQADEPEYALFVDNWIRLGLITVDYLSSLSDKSRYDWANTAPAVIKAREQYDTDSDQRVDIQHGVLRATALGKAFFRTVIVPPHPLGLARVMTRIAPRRARYGASVRWSDEMTSRLAPKLVGGPWLNQRARRFPP
jgi:hypothetical protein